MKYELNDTSLLELKSSRVIIHIDLDAFYAQVEHNRLDYPRDKPLCVLQWNGLLAINYPARKFGIKRHSTPAEALSLCPEVKLVHVATYRNDDPEPRYHDNPHYQTHKVCLDFYRRASAKIFEVFNQHVSKVQKGSVDEAHFDVTEEVNQLIISGDWKDDISEREKIENLDLIGRWENLGVLVGDSEIEYTQGLKDLQLYVGAKIAKKVREAVFSELGYTCSAGIAHNKTLSKLCSGLNKPFNQTILRESQVLSFMKELPFKNIRNLGGKLGREVKEWSNVTFAGELWSYSVEKLQEKFGEEFGYWLYNIVRGVCNAEVKVPDENKSKTMAANKSFRSPVRDVEQGRHWLNILSSELYTRLLEENEMNSRWPKTIAVHCFSKSKSSNFPNKYKIKSPSDVSKKAVELFNVLLAENEEQIITNISLNFYGFIKEEEGNSSILDYFKRDDLQEKIDKNVSTSPMEVSNDDGSLDKKKPFFLMKENFNSVDSNEKKNDLGLEKEEEFLKFNCPRCNKSIFFDKEEEHNDLHFAIDLQNGEKPNDDNDKDSISNTTTLKKKELNLKNLDKKKSNVEKNINSNKRKKKDVNKSPLEKKKPKMLTDFFPVKNYNDLDP
ncbi:DNA-directed DNA polymerase eta rad30 [Lobulomyces angularis]|nr:DNA-directed DNA polymerase eta rad30 [Lobulomyces angularis]